MYHFELLSDYNERWNRKVRGYLSKKEDKTIYDEDNRRVFEDESKKVEIELHKRCLNQEW